MGKKSAPEQPPVPDAGEIIAQDTQANRINQFTPKGSLEFSGPNNSIANLNLSETTQGLFDQGQALQGSLLGLGQNFLNSGAFGNGVNLDTFNPIQQGFDDSNINFNEFGSNTSINPQDFNLGPGQQQAFQQDLDLSGLPEIPQDFAAFRNRIEDAHFDRGSRLLNPQFQRQEEQLRQTLANQGLFAGDQAAGEQFQIQGQNQNRAFQDLADQSVLRGSQEASRQMQSILAARGQGFGEQLGAGQFNNQAIASNFGQDLGAFGANAAARGQELGEVGFNNQVNAQQAQLAQQQLQNNNQGRQQALLEQLGIQQGNQSQLAQLLGLGNPTTPGLSDFFGPGQADVLGANSLQANVANQNYQGQLQQQQGAMGGKFGLGSAGIGALGDIFSS